jgi:hypothetical protein
MKKEKIKCPISLKEYDRYIKNRETYDKLTYEQKIWLEELFENYDYNFTDDVLMLVDGILWVVSNTPNYTKESKW